MQCLNCHNTVPEGSRFCNNCGSPLAREQPAPATSASVSAQGDSTVGGDVVGRDKIIQIIYNLYGVMAPGPAPLPLVEALERYLTHLIDSNKTLRLQGIRAGNQPVSVNLEKVYVSLTVRDVGGARDQRQTPGKSAAPGEILEHDSGALAVPRALERHRRLVIVGDPGSGKTTLLAYLTLTYARAARGPDDVVRVRLGLGEAGHLPILLPLRFLGGHLREKHPNPAADGPALLLNFLREFYQNQSIPLPEDFFAKPLEKGQTVVLLDGMDEVADRDLRARVARLIEKFVIRYPGNRYVVTSRKVGYDGPARLGEAFALAEVRDFNTPEVRQFLRDWTRVLEATLAGEVTPELLRQAAKQADDLIAAIERNPRVAELAVNPLLLTVIALVHRQRAKLPNRRSELYAEAVDVLLGNWDEAKEGVKPRLEVAGRPLDAIDRRAILEPVAYWMHERQLREIDQADLAPRLGPSFDKLTGGDAAATKRAIKTFLELINERSGLFVARGLGVYGFAHLTFQEYLAARALADRDDAEALVQAKLGDAWWREALFLAPGSTESKRRASQLIRAILEAEAVGDRHEHLVLAAECVLDVGEVRVEGDLLGEVKRRLKREAEAPEPKKEKGDQRRRWVLRKIAAVNALSRIESGELTQRYWKPDTGEPDWVTIPAGEFWMGSGAADKDADNDEKPIHQVEVPEFQIARVPITNAQYGIYVAETNVDPPQHWRGNRPPQGKEDHPVVYVSWHDAQGYCRWLSQKIGRPVRLPTEAEWEKAARGNADTRAYPWGDTWDALLCNSDELGLGDTSPVGFFPAGASPYGALDMLGNVWEWCQSLMEAYPYKAEDGRENLESGGTRVLRGGSFLYDRRDVRCAFRIDFHPVSRHGDYGFRVVVVSPGPS